MNECTANVVPKIKFPSKDNIFGPNYKFSTKANVTHNK